MNARLRRRLSALTVGVCTVLGGVVASSVGAAPASAAPPSSGALGVFTPLPTVRVFDSGVIPSVGQTPVAVQLAGVGGIATDASAVVVNVEVYAPSAAGYVRVTPYGSNPQVANQEFAAGQTISNQVTVKLAQGSAQVSVSAGLARVLMDVAGYYGNGEGSTYHPIATSRLVGGLALSPTPQQIQVAGRAGIPPDATAVVATAEVYAPTAAGYLRATPFGEDPQVANQEFGTGQAISNLVTVALSQGSIQAKVNAGSAKLYLDVSGYFANDSSAGYSFVPLPTTRVFDSKVPSVGTTPIPVGIGGYGVSANAVAVVVNTEIYQPTASGYVRVTPWGSDPQVATQEFRAGETISDAGTVALSSGDVQVKVSAGFARVLMDVSGYYEYETALPQVSASRYVRNIDGSSSDVATMRAEGAADAASGSTFVVLDIGAQLNDGSGVELSGTDTTLTYAQLVTALQAYLSGFGSVDDAAIVIATNNDGDWTNYPAAARGADWANKVVNALSATVPTAVYGADDIEAGFASTEAQAEQWEAAYLAAANSKQLAFVGSADGCPTAPGAAGTCSYGWTQQDYYALAGGADPGHIVALPQIYFDVNATQWANIDASGNRQISFVGSLTQHASACGNDCVMTPGDGWSWLYDALAAIDVTPGNVATDLQVDT